jgi:hypothetical protein
MNRNFINLKRYSRLLLLLIFLPLTACMAYVDSSIEALTPGTNARIRLDEDSFGRVVNQAASDGYNTQRLDYRRRGLLGRVTESTSDSLSVLLRGSGSSVYTVRVPNWAISESAVREFDLKRTGIVVGGTALFFGAAFGRGWIGGTTSLGTNPNAPPVNLMTPVPIFSIPLP